MDDFDHLADFRSILPPPQLATVDHDRILTKVHQILAADYTPLSCQNANTVFYQACQTGCTTAIKLLLAAGYSPVDHRWPQTLDWTQYNQVCHYQLCINRAGLNGHLDTVRVLLSQDLTYNNAARGLPLGCQLLCRSESCPHPVDLKLVKLLLLHGYDDRFSDTLNRAVRYLQLELVEMLVIWDEIFIEQYRQTLNTSGLNYSAKIQRFRDQHESKLMITEDQIGGIWDGDRAVITAIRAQLQQFRSNRDRSRLPRHALDWWPAIKLTKITNLADLAVTLMDPDLAIGLVLGSSLILGYLAWTWTDLKTR